MNINANIPYKVSSRARVFLIKKKLRSKDQWVAEILSHSKSDLGSCNAFAAAHLSEIAKQIMAGCSARFSRQLLTRKLPRTTFRALCAEGQNDITKHICVLVLGPYDGGVGRLILVVVMLVVVMLVVVMLVVARCRVRGGPLQGFCVLVLVVSMVLALVLVVLIVLVLVVSIVLDFVHAPLGSIQSGG